MDEQTIHIAAAAILNERRQLLLVRKAGTRAFMQPGGKIEAHETPLQALLRELREELSLNFHAGDASYLGAFDAPAANEAGCRVVAEIYSLSYCGAVSANAEIEEVAWYPGGLPDNAVLAPLTRDHVIPASGV